MNRRRVFGTIVVLTALGVAGGWWLRRGGPTSGQESVSLSWKGKYQGSVTIPATVNWCPGSRIAIVEAISNDTGFAMVIHAADTLAKGTMAMLPQEFLVNGPRPAASAGLRWPVDTATLAGFRAQTGVLELVLAAGRLSGTFTARMQPQMSLDTIIVTGSFRNLLIESRAAGCP